MSAIKLFIDFSSLDSDIKFIDFMEKSNEELRIEQEELKLSSRQIAEIMNVGKGTILNIFKNLE